MVYIFYYFKKMREFHSRVSS